MQLFFGNYSEAGVSPTHTHHVEENSRTSLDMGLFSGCVFEVSCPMPFSALTSSFLGTSYLYQNLTWTNSFEVPNIIEDLNMRL